MARRIPSLNALRAFEAAGRHGRMTRAAEELHVSHSAISRQVQHLEQILGVPLFEGPRNALRLTEAGRTLLPGLSAAFDGIDAAVRLVADTAEGVLDVSCLGAFSMRWLIPRLHRFRATHPAIDVRLTQSDRPVEGGRDQFDVAIRIGPGPWPGMMRVQPMFGERIGPVLAPTFAAMAAPDFAGIPILYTRTRHYAWVDWCSRSGIPVETGGSIAYESFYFMLEAATAGLGVAVAPWPLVAEDIRTGRLIAPHGFVPSGQTYVAIRSERPHKKSAFFCAWLAQEALDFTQGVDPPGPGGPRDT